MQLAHPKPSPLKRIRVKFRNRDERLVVRADLPEPEKVSWSPSNRHLFVEAVEQGLLPEAELNEKYNVTLEQLKGTGPVRAREKKPSEKRKPRRIRRNVAKPAWVDESRYQPITMPHKGILRVGDVQFNLDEDDVTLGSKLVRLSRDELVMMSVFMFHAGRKVSKSQTLFALAQYGMYPSWAGLNAYIWALRKKLGEYKDYLQTCDNEGYVFQAPVAE